MKSEHKTKLVKHGLPIGIFLAIIVGVLSFPNVAGNYSPYTSLGIIYLFDDWSMVNTMGYVTMFAMIQFFLIAFVLGILILKFTRKVAKKQWWSSLFLIISMGIFLLIVLLFIIWITAGLFEAYLNDVFNGDEPGLFSRILANAISYVFPSLILGCAIVALIIWLTYYFPTLRLPTKRHKFNYKVFKLSDIPWSGKDKQLKTIAWISIGVAGLEIIFTTISIHFGNSDTEIYNSIWEKLWFGTMHHFTELSNLWVAVFFVVILLNYKFKFLKTSCYVTMTFTYISVTFLIADFLLAPFMILNHSSGNINMGFGGKSSWWDWVKTFLFHVVQPLMVMFFFIFFCKSKRQYRPWKFSRIVPLTMIFPILYLAYAISINYLPIEHLQKLTPDGKPVIIHGGISVYGYFTCLNPNVHANVFSVQTGLPVWQGKPTNGVWYAFAICLFLGLAFYYNWIERHTMALRYLRDHKLYTSNLRLHWN